jgi:hypothetical protein
MVCANPDLVVIHRGKAEICAGAIAQRYEQLAGPVQYFGKPHPPIYRDCFALLGISDRRRILAVGDSLRTDIAGANAAGIDGLLVLGGIHQEELTEGDLESVIRRQGVIPTAAGPYFAGRCRCLTWAGLTGRVRWQGDKASWSWRFDGSVGDIPEGPADTARFNRASSCRAIKSRGYSGRFGGLYRPGEDGPTARICEAGQLDHRAVVQYRYLPAGRCSSFAQT